MRDPVIIFGATGGIGGALTRMLLADGVPVHAVGRDEEKLKQLEGVSGTSIADTTDPEQVARAVGEAGDRLSGLVYAVGSITLKPLRSTSADELLAAFQLNLVGAVMALKAAVKPLAEGRGSAVFFSTIAVGQGFANHSIISSAKGAVEGFVKAAAAELAPKVRVNAVAPSLTRTPLSEKLTSSAQMADAIAKLHPIERLGEPEDAAAAARYLLSPEAGWVTGQIIGVDGGRSTLRTKG